MWDGNTVVCLPAFTSRKSYVMLAEPASSAASESFRVNLELRMTKYAACVLARIQDLSEIYGITIGRPQSLLTYLVILNIFWNLIQPSNEGEQCQKKSTNVQVRRHRCVQ